MKKDGSEAKPEKERKQLSDEELEKVDGGYTVKYNKDICELFEPIPDYPVEVYHCMHCIHFVRSSRITGRCDAR